MFKINDKAEIIDKWFGRTVTYSDARFAYEEAQLLLKITITTEPLNIPEDISITGKHYERKKLFRSNS